MAKQLLALRTSLQNLNEDISDVEPAVFVEWVNFLADYIWPKLQNLDPENFIQTQAFSVPNSPSAQSLPDNFEHLRLKGAGIFLLDQNGNPTESRLPMTNYGSSMRGYWIGGGNINFTGINSPESFMMRYLPQRARFTSVNNYFTVDGLITGVPIVPDGKMEVIVKGLDTFHKQWDNDPGMESVADQRFIRTLSSLFIEYRNEPSVYVVPQSTNAF